MSACGIYGILNKNNGRIYVGQSVNISSRWAFHKSELRRQMHFNEHLQRSWNKYGEQSFEFLILEECEEENLNEREHMWIKDKKPNVFNFEHDVLVGGRMSEETRKKMSESSKGKNNSFYGKRHKEDSKEKMSQWKKENYLGVNNPNYAKKHSISSRSKMSIGRSKNLNEQDVRDIVQRLEEGKSHQSIASEFGIGRTTVTRINSGARWSNITGGPVDKKKGES